MHGCRLSWIASLAALSLTGCGDVTLYEPQRTEEPAVELGAEFDPAQCGSLQGRVLWEGDIPAAEPMERWLAAEGGTKVSVCNPLVPVVDRDSRGVRDAVVFLRGVDARKAKPWDLPGVRVEQRDWQIRVCQGEQEAQVGFVRRGDEIKMISKQQVFHSLHLSGADWVTLAFPDPDVVRRRRLSHRGLVELSSAAGYYWARGFLFVDDHPYYVRTDGQGRFKIDQVPAGNYQVVCWVPGWKEIKHTRDPESARITRTVLEPALENVRDLSVRPKALAQVQFAIHRAPPKP